MDERCDNVRAIRDQKVSLHQKLHAVRAVGPTPELPLDRMKATQAWEQHHREGKTDADHGPILWHQADGGTLRYRC